MSERIIQYYFTPVSPWAYLGAARLEEIAARHRVPIAYKPCDYSRIFPASGGLPLAKRAPQRQAYRLVDLKRWSEHLDLPLTLRPKYSPTPDGAAARLIIAALLAGRPAGPLALALHRAVWTEERDIADRNTLIEIATEQGFDGPALVAASETPEPAALWDRNTEEAIERQVFGAPTYIFNDEPFWGQDRLDFLDRAIARA
jgi:2-hydroxychromene-2-carboxylate isomerase